MAGRTLDEAGFDAARDGIGAPVRRLEDRRFLTGSASYVSDIHAPDALHAVFVRSAHAHARIRDIDLAAARAGRGVVAVFSGADMEADRVGPMRTMWSIKSPDAPPMAEPPRFALARDTARYVGEPVVVVIAETSINAQDAAERISVDYDVQPAITSAAHAIAADAPRLHESAPGNVCFRWIRGDRPKVEAAFGDAAHVVTADLVNHRIGGAAIEPRAILAIPPGGRDKLALYTATQVPHHIRRLVSEQLGISEARLRVISPDVGGGFGYKGKLYAEESVLPWAAGKIGRPVRWVASRNESFLSDYQARDHRTRAELALDRDGRYLALRVKTYANVGAYVSTFGAAIPSAIYSALLAGVYATPAISVECIGVFTNTVPTDAYRGAGRPEACYVLERLADRAAARLGLDCAEIRRRNLVPATAMPYQTPIGPTYDSGDFPRVFERALVAAGYSGFPARREAARRSGRLLGIGIACFVESSGVAPSRFAGMLGARAGFYESAAISLEPDGSVRAKLGTHSHGQGHATSMAQILATQLGVPVDRIEIVEGDTDIVPYGTGTFGSRSIAVGGSALVIAAKKIIEKGRLIAAHMLEVSEHDLRFEDGRYVVAGTNHAVGIADVAHAAYIPHHFPLETLEPGLQETAVYDPKAFAFSNGAHVCEVSVDPETGHVALERYCAVDDIGTVINPMIASGQVHGGVAQGLGQAILEYVAYDASSGQALSGSFMDYALPRARDVPFLESEFDESQPCAHNPLGAKGCGEAGTIAAPAAITGAVLDALRQLGVREIDMPLTPSRVWEAIRSAKLRSQIGQDDIGGENKGRPERHRASRPGACKDAG
ncbi:MAG: xanthine dehydrogenase family protein molybdopterin-binding subunit [Pseudorhodoplanes sp.]|uniref:xanthine dehydrogenase family protein molybdopterin-binding subunit n=1 Tax=Pseudorhodoplanes sp. TaxID=1934341 RepID=UPI003D0AEC61